MSESQAKFDEVVKVEHREIMCPSCRYVHVISSTYYSPEYAQMAGQLASLREENERISTFSREEGARLYDCRSELDEAKKQLRAWNKEQGDILNLRDREIDILRRGLEYYAKHESVIKEAYHSNDEKQIRVIHTFINHKAIEALAEADKLSGRVDE